MEKGFMSGMGRREAIRQNKFHQIVRIFGSKSYWLSLKANAKMSGRFILITDVNE